jgi:hypothetical protein
MMLVNRSRTILCGQQPQLYLDLNTIIHIVPVTVLSCSPLEQVFFLALELMWEGVFSALKLPFGLPRVLRTPAKAD